MAYYGAEKLEDVIKAGNIKANYSRNYSRYKAKYDELVDLFFSYGKSFCLNKDGKYIGFCNSYADKYIDADSLSFPEAIADLQAEFCGNFREELYKKADDYNLLRRNLFIRFSDTLSSPLNWINSAIVEGDFAGILEVDISLDLMRRGINFYARSYHLIEVSRNFSLGDNLTSVHVTKSNFKKTIKLLDQHGFKDVLVSELK